ncbi:MAG: hypothetical protein ACJ768_19590 [Gaiellaceae bacterium]
MDTADESLLRDERGSRSSMRVLLFAVAMPVLAGMTIAEAAGVREFQPVVWSSWVTIATMLIAGCFGPRIAQYLAPQISAAVQAIAQAKRDPRQPSRLDKHAED